MNHKMKEGNLYKIELLKVEPPGPWPDPPENNTRAGKMAKKPTKKEKSTVHDKWNGKDGSSFHRIKQ